MIVMGMADTNTPYYPATNVTGDDKSSWAFDGARAPTQGTWHNGPCPPFGTPWNIGDILGCYVDVDKRGACVCAGLHGRYCWEIAEHLLSSLTAQAYPRSNPNKRRTQTYAHVHTHA